MSAQIALLIVLGAPLLHAALVALLPRPPGLRDLIHIGFSLLSAVAALKLVDAAAHGETLRLSLVRPLPNVDLAFAIEPLGVLMTAVVSVLGVLHAIHAAGMARAAPERAPARLMALIALATSATAAALLAANLLTFFIAGQVLILAVFPMVAYRGDEAARRGARTYLAVLLTASIGLFLPAMVWTYAMAGLEFRPGGILAGHFEDVLTPNLLLTLFTLGLAMTAMPPAQAWLSASTNAPYPALAPIQALTLLPVGGVGLIKVVAYVFGTALPDAAMAARALTALAGVAMCLAALLALSKQDLRERAAYSAMAQSMAAVMGALIIRPDSAIAPQALYAATLQIVALTVAATTLLMAIGTTHAVTGRSAAAQYAGLGRLMPWTFAGFALACASMIGMPPFAGAWAKLWLITAAAEAKVIWAAVLVGAGAALTFAHLAPLAAQAMIAPAPADAMRRPDGASVMLVAPVVLAAAATLLLLVLADPLAYFLMPLWTVAP